MKKRSLFIFFILIFSVFFSYKTAFAFTLTQQTPTIGTNVNGANQWLDISGYDVGTGSGAGVFNMRFCQGTDYGTCSHLERDYGANGGSIYYYFPARSGVSNQSWSPENWIGGGGYADGNPPPDGNYYMEFYEYNYYSGSFHRENGEYYVFTRTTIGGTTTWNGVGAIPADGITQATPVASSSIPYNMTFTGTYNNYYGTQRVLIATAITGTPSIYSSASITISAGTWIAYTIPLLLSPNQTYSYTMIMCDAGGMTCTSPTSPISFSTNGLTGAISPPVWTAESCTWTDFSTWTGCLDNVFHDLFSPSSESLMQYNGLYAQFIHKPPFGYIVAIQTALSGINDTATSAFTLESMPILNTYIFDPIRLALAWVLWVAFAFVLYHRLKNIAI
jgi:hypothetical protein